MDPRAFVKERVRPRILSMSQQVRHAAHRRAARRRAGSSPAPETSHSSTDAPRELFRLVVVAWNDVGVERRLEVPNMA